MGEDSPSSGRFLQGHVLGFVCLFFLVFVFWEAKAPWHLGGGY